MRWPLTFIRTCEFFPFVNSISWWQTAFEWGSVSCSRRIFIVREMMEWLEQRKSNFVLKSHRTSRTPQTVTWLHEYHNHWWRVLGVRVRPGFQIPILNENPTRRYLTKILLDINWRYWQAGKNSHMRMKVQDRLMKARFIEIHQVFSKKKSSNTFLTKPMQTNCSF